MSKENRKEIMDPQSDQLPEDAINNMFNPQEVVFSEALQVFTELQQKEVLSSSDFEEADKDTFSSFDLGSLNNDEHEQRRVKKIQNSLVMIIMKNPDGCTSEELEKITLLSKSRIEDNLSDLNDKGWLISTRVKQSSYWKYQDLFGSEILPQIEKYEPLLKYIIKRIRNTSRHDILADILQSVYVSAYEIRTTIDPREQSLQGWLSRIARYKALESGRVKDDQNVSLEKNMNLTHKSNPNMPELNIIDESLSPEPISINNEALYTSLDKIKELPLQDRDAIFFRNLCGLSFADIAIILDVNTPVAKMRYHRAMGRLIGKLREEGYSEEEIKTVTFYP